MRITLVHAGALGDTVLLAPLLRSLQARWPRCRRTVVMRAEFGRMLVRMKLAEAWADGDSVDHARWFAWHETGSGQGELVPVPEWANCDLLISAVGNGEDAWSKNAHLASDAEIHFFQPRPLSENVLSVPEFHRRQLVALHLPPDPIPPARATGTGPIILAPGAGSRHKCLPITHFIALAREVRESGHQVAFMLGPVEWEKFSSVEIADLRNKFNIYKCETPDHLLDLFESSAGFIGNDSGPGHVAAAIGLPTLTLFSAGDPRQWSPIGPRVRVVAGPTADSLLLAAKNQLPWLLAEGQQA